MNTRLILTGFLALLSMGFFGSTAYAGEIMYESSADFVLTKNRIDLRFVSGSSADLVTVGASSVTVAVSGSDKFKIRSTDRYELANDAGIPFVCKDNYSELIISGDRIVVVTPVAKKCLLPSEVAPPEPVAPQASSTPAESAVELAPKRDLSIEDALSDLSRLQAELESIDRDNVRTCGYMRDMTLGSSGDDVKGLQKELIMKDFLNVTPTGIFGPATKLAVSKWQAANGISPSTGYFGPASRVKLQGATVVSDSILCIARDLKLGSSGEDVLVLQNFLKSQGAEIYPEGLVTGRFGAITRAAVQRFQLKNGIVVSVIGVGYGSFGPKTRAKISELLGR